MIALYRSAGGSSVFTSNAQHRDINFRAGLTSSHPTELEAWEMKVYLGVLINPGTQAICSGPGHQHFGMLLLILTCTTDGNYRPEPPCISRGLGGMTLSLIYGCTERRVVYIERGLLW